MNRPTPSDPELAFAKSFVQAARKDRVVASLANPKHRAKLRSSLAHCKWLDQRFRVEFEPSEHSADRLASLLRKHGAPELCRLISERSELDGAGMSLPDALERIVGYGMGTIVICIPDRLAYYEGEEQGERYLLVR